MKSWDDELKHTFETSTVNKSLNYWYAQTKTKILALKRFMRIDEKCIKRNKSKVKNGQTNSWYRLQDIKRSDEGAGRWLNTPSYPNPK